MIQIRNQLYQNIHNLDNRGHIRISATSQWGLRMISDIIPRFKEAFPDVTFELSHLDVDILEKMIDEEKLDFALVSISAKENLNPTSEILRKEEMLFAVPANDPYCKKNPSNEITEEELAHTFYNTNFFLSKKGTANRTLGDQLFSRHNLALTSLCEVNGMIMTRDMVAQGIGAAFIPTSCRADEEHVHYYSLSPKLYRYNALMHRKNLVLNQPEQLFYSYVMNYFNDDMESI
ncbi:MAG: LysR family transcriptional regulator substrate-binding protein [Lachnospiraceae bacterium]|nr:LysR family transcriptional regulator substrate-binding protein [Lachnospiraceae bacterium]